MLAMQERRLWLEDGRRVGLAECGDVDSEEVVFWFHGTPGCRWSVPDAGVTSSCGARLIALDRPGYGASDPHPGRTFTSFARDVVQCADALGIGRFAVAGASGAGPYLCAVAARHPDRVTAAAMLGVVGPMGDPRMCAGMPWPRRLVLWTAKRLPRLVATIVRILSPAQLPELTYRLAVVGFPAADRARLKGGVWDEKVRVVREAFRCTTAGFTSDLQLLTERWDIELAEIRVPVHLWHGELDRSTPVAMGRHLAQHIPKAEATFLPGVGHDVHGEHWEEALRELLEQHRLHRRDGSALHEAKGVPEVVGEGVVLPPQLDELVEAENP